MRRFALLIALLTLIAACDEGPETCPSDPPFEAGAGIASLQLAPVPVSSHAAPPLRCAYFDRCGEIVCTSVDDGWTCVRDDASPGNCAGDAGADDD